MQSGFEVFFRGVFLPEGLGNHARMKMEDGVFCTQPQGLCDGGFGFWVTPRFVIDPGEHVVGGDVFSFENRLFCDDDRFV